MKTYKAIVWPKDDVPGIRVELEAESLKDAMKQLEAEYGVNAVISLRNEEDARRPR